MKKVLALAVLGILVSSAFCFDFDRDDFAMELDMETALFVHQDNLYIKDGYEKLWKCKRPSKIVNEYGYAELHFGDNPFFYGYSAKGEGYYLIDLRGELFGVGFKKNKAFDENFSSIYGGVQSIKASSELVENTKSGRTVYGVRNVLCIGSEKETGYFMDPLGCPWVPDISRDKEPYIDVETRLETSSVFILPGFVDFSRQHLWKQNARPKTVEVLDTETSESLGKYTVEDAIKFTELKLPRSVKKIRIKFLDFYPGTKYQDPCVAALVFGNENFPYKGNYGQDTFKEDGYFTELLKKSGI